MLRRDKILALKANRITAAGIGALLASSVFSVSNAAEIRVQVLDKARDRALAGAAVCLGTPANPVQFGAHRTGESGFAIFDNVPETPLVLTVSRRDYTGYQRNHASKSFDLTLQVKMRSGGLGPICSLGEQAFEPQLTDGPITITELSLANGASTTNRQTVSISASITGTPTHYRVAEHWSFDDAEWQSLEQSPEVTLSSGVGKKRIYFQVRRVKSVEGGEVESLSGIAQATITLTN